jgi:hypothetical protein
MLRVLLSLFAALLLLIPSYSFAQDDFEKWDKNYPVINFHELLKAEKKYADSVEANPAIAQTYSRIDNYSFIAEFSGEKRTLQPRIKSTMDYVYRLFIGDSKQLNSLVENEYLFKVGTTSFWAPIQKQLEKPLIQEIKKGQKAKIYCVYFNEHSSAGLQNIFLISEFRKE